MLVTVHILGLQQSSNLSYDVEGTSLLTVLLKKKTGRIILSREMAHQSTLKAIIEAHVDFTVLNSVIQCIEIAV